MTGMAERVTAHAAEMLAEWPDPPPDAVRDAVEVALLHEIAAALTEIMRPRP